MSPQLTNDQDKEDMSRYLAHLLYKNWATVDMLIQSQLRVKLSKAEAVEVAKRALELMEEMHI
jgi:hypothetical protein